VSCHQSAAVFHSPFRPPYIKAQHFNTTVNISKMTIKLLKQELTKRGLPTDGLKPALVERLELALMKNSSAEADVAALEDQDW